MQHDSCVWQRQPAGSEEIARSPEPLASPSGPTGNGCEDRSTAIGNALSDRHCRAVLSTEGMPLPQRQALLAWVREETERQQITPSALLDRLRDDLRTEVLEE
jgi:hypothetical protein